MIQIHTCTRRVLVIFNILSIILCFITTTNCFDIIENIRFDNTIILRRQYYQQQQQNNHLQREKRSITNRFLTNNDSNHQNNDYNSNKDRISNDEVCLSLRIVPKTKYNIQKDVSRRILLKSTARRIAFATVVATSPLTVPSLLVTSNANAATTTARSSSTPISATTTAATTTRKVDDVPITHTVLFNVRISRADGTFYDKNEAEPVDTNDYDNQVFIGQLKIGLFGTYAPNCVEKFLSYTVSPEGGAIFDDNPFPNYSRSSFTKYDDLTGIVTAGVIPKLEVVELNNNNVLKYGTRIIPATLWIDKVPSNEQRIKHIGKGLLTHKLLDPSPQFGITTRTDTTMVDTTNIVFGKILIDDTSKEFLSRVVAIPTYSIDRPASFNSNNSDNAIVTDDSLVQEAASAIFNAQRDFFRGAAKSFGDDRISKVYDGKFLRRIEVTKVTVV